jgi:hypothetical protein
MFLFIQKFCLVIQHSRFGVTKRISERSYKHKGSIAAMDVQDQSLNMAHACQRSLKTSHSLEQKTAAQDHDAGPMGHVERSHSECASNDLQFTRKRLVPLADRPRAWDRERPSGDICCWQNQPFRPPGVEGTGEPKPAISTAGKGIGRKSQCEPLAIVRRILNRLLLKHLRPGYRKKVAGFDPTADMPFTQHRARNCPGQGALRCGIKTPDFGPAILS